MAAGMKLTTTALNRVDEIGMILRSVNQSSLKIRALLEDVVYQVEGLNHSTEKVASGSVDLSVRVEESRANLQQTNASMEEISSTLHDNVPQLKKQKILRIKRVRRQDKGASCWSSDSNHARYFRKFA